MKLPENKTRQMLLDSNIGNVCFIRFQKQKQKTNKNRKNKIISN